jgi:Flp pilus assembly secretin CpaC
MTRRLLLAALVGALCSPSVTPGAEKPVPVTGPTYPTHMPYATDTPSNSDIEVAFEVRFFSVSDECLEHLGLDVASKKPIFLDDKQAFKLCQDAQKDVNTNIMQAPRLTLLDGQQSVLQVGETQAFVTGVSFARSDTGMMVTPLTTTIDAGTRVSLKPDVSADRRFVHVAVEAELTYLDEPVAMESLVLPDWVTVAKADGNKSTAATQQIQLPVKIVQLMVSNKVTIPDGGTVLFPGQKSVSQVREERKVPLLGELPYVGDLFKSVSTRQVNENIFMTVKAHIIPAEEVEGTPPISGCGIPY